MENFMKKIDPEILSAGAKSLGNVLLNETKESLKKENLPYTAAGIVGFALFSGPLALVAAFGAPWALKKVFKK